MYVSVLLVWGEGVCGNAGYVLYERGGGVEKKYLLVYVMSIYVCHGIIGLCGVGGGGKV